jgi:GR25 family glycosyltransferase involved in LPS biosynthesis
MSTNSTSSNSPSVDLLELHTIDIPIWVIHLDHHSDRWETLQQQNQLQSYVLPLTPFNAMDGDSLIPTLALESLFPRNQISMSPNEIGCLLSHIQCWINLIYQSEWNACIILEDTVTFVPDMKEKLNHVLEQVAETDWGLIFLGHALKPEYYTKKTTHPSIFPTLIAETADTLKQKSYGGTSGYIIHRRGAEMLLDFIHQVGFIDSLGRMMQMAARGIHVYTCTPRLIDSPSFTHLCSSSENNKTPDPSSSNALVRDVSVQLQEVIETYRDMNINVEICDSTHPCDHTCTRSIYICQCKCECPCGAVFLYGNDIQVHIPDPLYQGAVRNRGIRVGDRYTLQSIVKK